MTWESTVRTRRAPGAFFALVFRGFGRVDAGLDVVDAVAGESFDDAGKTSTYRSTRRIERRSPSRARRVAYQAGFRLFVSGRIYGTRRAASPPASQIIP